MTRETPNMTKPPIPQGIRGRHASKQGSELDLQVIGDRLRLATEDVAVRHVLGVEDLGVVHLNFAFGDGAGTRPALAFLAGVRPVQALGAHYVAERLLARPDRSADRRGGKECGRTC